MRLIDADALEKEFCHGCQYENNKYVNCIDCAVANAPTINAIEVVRCKECKHRPEYDGPNHIVFPDGICPCQCEDCYYDWMPSDDWFCADGERKEK